MGCNQSVGSLHPAPDLLLQKVFQAIRSNSVKRLGSLLKYHLKSLPVSVLDDSHLSDSGKTFNPLTLSALLGNSKAFDLLLKHGCSLLKMESLLRKQNLSLIEIICVNGHLDLLKVYFPHYKELKRHKSENDFTSSFIYEYKNEVKLTPVQLASFYGQVEVVEFFYKHWENSEDKYPEFNVHAVDEVTGENCAFIACRQGHLELVKYLNSTCGADFLSLNLSKESTVMVAVAGMKKNLSFSYVEVVEYLVETVKVDLLYNYEEVLISAQLPCLVEYLESKLKELGVFVSKKMVDKHIMKSVKLVKESVVSNGPFFTSSFLKSIEDNRRQSRLSSIGVSAGSFESEPVFEDLFGVPGH